MNYYRIASPLVTMCMLTMASTILLTGCGKKDKLVTQVVASVEGEEITVQQINGVLSKARGISPENLSKAKVEILGSLVEQQLAINMAISKKLDRSPEVVAALESARRDILSRAALEQIAASQAKPTDEDAKKYYIDHPELFSERRIFNVQEIAFGKNVENIDEIRIQIGNSRTMEELAAWLKAKNIQFAANAGSRAAEQVPLEVLPKLHAFKDGQIGLIESNDAYLVMHVVGSRLQSVSEVQALPTIKLFLMNQRGAEAVKLAKEEMKSKANIKYFGEFAGGEASFKAKAEADTKAAVEATEQAKFKAKAESDLAAKLKSDEQAATIAEQEARSKARAEARAQIEKEKGTASETSQINLEKGLKGLK